MTRYKTFLVVNNICNHAQKLYKRNFKIIISPLDLWLTVWSMWPVVRYGVSCARWDTCTPYSEPLTWKSLSIFPSLQNVVCYIKKRRLCKCSSLSNRKDEYENLSFQKGVKEVMALHQDIRKVKGLRNAEELNIHIFMLLYFNSNIETVHSAKTSKKVRCESEISSHIYWLRSKFHRGVRCL